MDAVAIHPHHRDIGLEVVYGTLTNRIYKAGSGVFHRRFLHDSAIVAGGTGFVRDFGGRLLTCSVQTLLRLGTTMFQNADVLHTVEVGRFLTAAWRVSEGLEDPEYRPICYSTKDLTEWKPYGLYQEMDEQYFNTLLQEVEAATVGADSRS